MFVNLTIAILVCYVLRVCSNIIKIILKFSKHHTNPCKNLTSKPHCDTLFLVKTLSYTFANMDMMNPIGVGMTYEPFKILHPCICYYIACSYLGCISHTLKAILHVSSLISHPCTSHLVVILSLTYPPIHLNSNFTN